MPSPASWIAHSSGQKAMCDRDAAAADGGRPTEGGAGRNAPLSPSSRLNELDPLYRYSARYADTLAPVALVDVAVATSAAATAVPAQAGVPELRRRNRIVSDSESCRPVSSCLGCGSGGAATASATTTAAAAAAQQPEGKAQRSRDARFRRRQDARYRTQPVTFDEIKEIDELLMDDVSASAGNGGGSGGGGEQAQRQLRPQDSCPAAWAVILAPVSQQPSVSSGGSGGGGSGSGGGSKARRDSE